MARLTLVRHGEASAGWGDHSDPGLSAVGEAQAAAVAAELGALAPQGLVVSPLRRTRETAAPLAVAWGLEPVVEPRVAEIPSPIDGLTQRSEWLRQILASRWSAIDPSLQDWADQLVACLLALRADTVVVTHFVAINAAIARATDDDRVVCAHVGNCSQTTFETRGGRLVLVDLADDAAITEVR